MAETNTKLPMIGKLTKAFGAPDFEALEREVRERLDEIQALLLEVREELRRQRGA